MTRSLPRKSNEFEGFGHGFGPLGGRSDVVHFERRGEDRADRLARIER